MNKYQDIEFKNIISSIESNEEFHKLKNIKHHGITRYEHSLRVAYYSYKVTKLLHLDYKDTTEAALLHDFFQEEVSDKNFIARLRKHPKYAVENAGRICDLNAKQIDIIKTHMFPITFTPPKYMESWIVDIVDDISAIAEQSRVIKRQAKVVGTFILVLLFHH